MLRYAKWEHWSLKITNSVPSLYRQWTLFVVLKIVIKKPFLITSNGERLIVSKTLWGTAPPEVKSNFPRFWFRDLGIRTGGLEIKRLKAHNLCDNGVFFLPSFSRNCDDQLSPHFYRFVIMHMLRYTKWEDWSLTITNGVKCL